MAKFITLNAIDGARVDVNPDKICALQALPNRTNVLLDSGTAFSVKESIDVIVERAGK